MYSDGEGAHDAFSVFCILWHGGDTKEALKDAGDNWVMVGDESWNKVKQKEYAQAESKKKLNTMVNDGYCVDSNGKSWDFKTGEVIEPANQAMLEFIHFKINPIGEITTPLATKENLECLMHYYGIRSSYDVIKKEVNIVNFKCLPGEEENLLIAHLKSQCALHSLPKCVVDEQLTAITLLNAYNPVTDVLKLLKRTKINNPIEELIGFLPIANEPWAIVALKRWLIQCCAAADAARNTPNKDALPKYELVLTFFGDQGTKKTSFIRALLPELLKGYMTDGLNLDLTNKDSVLEAVSNWIVELGEIDSTFKKSDISSLKSFLSKQQDNIRKPYAKAASSMPRQTSFVSAISYRETIFFEKNSQ